MSVSAPSVRSAYWKTIRRWGYRKLPLALTRYLAVELAPKNIVVNASLVDTDRTDHADATPGRRGCRRRIAKGCIVLVRLHPRTRRREMPTDAIGRIPGWHHDAPCSREQPRRAPAQRGDADVLVDQIAGGGDAPLALRHLGFAAIAPLRADQRDAGAQPGIVMHMHVVRHAEAADQIKHRWMVADQMVQFDDARAIARKQARQGRQFVRNDVAQVGKAIRGAVADRDTARAIGCTRRPQHDGTVLEAGATDGTDREHAVQPSRAATPHVAAWSTRCATDGRSGGPCRWSTTCDASSADA